MYTFKLEITVFL